MREIKNYTNIWRVEGVFYGIRDFTFPRPITYSQAIWFGVFFLLSLMFKGIPPFIFTDSILLNNVGIPIALAIFVNKKSFDNKKPISFILSSLRYFAHPKHMYLGRPVAVAVDRGLEDIEIMIGERRVCCEQETERVSGEIS